MNKQTGTSISNAIDLLQQYIESQQFKGYDPYDILNSVIPFRLSGTFGAAVATQLHKQNPFNLRPILGIKKGYNPKALGLLLSAYCKRQQLRPELDYTDQIHQLLSLLQQCQSKGFHGSCWGYNFAWASPGKFLPAYAPSGVVTAFVAKGLHACYEVTGNGEALNLLKGTADFIINDLKRVEYEAGTCISYTPYQQDCCYNASLLAAETLARVFAVTGDAALKEVSLRAVSFVISRQQEDGRWNYSWNKKNGTERAQIDFHQGYVIDSIDTIRKLTGVEWPEAVKAVEKGLEFYRTRQFTADGQSLWRYPAVYPVDIHNQSQGIITFAKKGDTFATTIATWTIQNMFDRERGYFYYRKYPSFTNKISYLRWSNAWMLVALAELESCQTLQPTK